MQGGTGRHARAYIGSFTSAGGRGITTAALDPRTGALSALHHTDDTVANPSFLALAPAGGLLYAVSETDRGAVAALRLDGPGPARSPGAGSPAVGPFPALLGGTVPVEGAGPTHLAVTGDSLCTANYTSGSVSMLPLRADGALGAPARTHQHRGRGPVAERQEGPHAHGVTPDPSGRWLLCTDLGTDSVWIYDLRDAAAGAGLRPHREVPLRPGTGPRHLAFGPAPSGSRRTAARRAYVVNELDSTVTTCSWDPRRGALEPLGETRLVPPERAAAANHPSALALAPDGRFAWAANRGDDSIAVLDLASSALPERVATVSCGGCWPRDLAVHPTGRRLYAANERSGDVTWFGIDPGTGIPVPVGSLPVPSASCVVIDPAAGA
ncbi:lactonase family protein [Streptomyces qinglanensis]|uniref:6-phosphogluconolactonase, cycloisomerase 2 family n=1 Tax=Streptomyces qinglanensis TaxID=943816 RepID=A0A1H9TY88_9ACTN|nr:lactonase family protein [Streptomyces qinglanensis]SES01877.1 6-phosphogluconolactonase, cycloisomerase 2 family [Streptomyces qinglanensis]